MSFSTYGNVLSTAKLQQMGSWLVCSKLCPKAVICSRSAVSAFPGPNAEFVSRLLQQQSVEHDFLGPNSKLAWKGCMKGDLRNDQSRPSGDPTVDSTVEWSSNHSSYELA